MTGTDPSVETQNKASSRVWLDILNNNKGFSHPEIWIDYARSHNFRKIKAEKLSCCPDCGASTWKKIGQYIYYSTLISLKACNNCYLVYADTRIDSQVIERHFETAYQDEEYFVEKRKGIFDQIVTIVELCAQKGWKVLDIGGAKGHLMALLKSRRPDLRLVVNDLSPSKCAWAESHYELETISGSAAEMSLVHGSFDVITIIDALYYEPNISKFWHLLRNSITAGGLVVIRVPNNLPMILIRQACDRLLTTRRAREMSTEVKNFNPEHLYIFSRKYLKGRLENLGFTEVLVMPSRLLIKSKGNRIIRGLCYGLARILSTCSLGHLILTPSFLIVAKSPSNH